jgi:hypothetical protein
MPIASITKNPTPLPEPDEEPTIRQFYDMVILQFEKQKCNFQNAMNNLEIKMVKEIVMLKEKIRA